jgi:phosphoketolase
MSRPRQDISSDLDQQLLERMDRYWNAINYLTVGQIYLQENPLLREPLRPEHIKPRLLGHWGTWEGATDHPSAGAFCSTAQFCHPGRDRSL